jgi:hypothetical protein
MPVLRPRSGARIEVAPLLNHDDSVYGVAKQMHQGVFVRSIYFFDPGHDDRR